MEYLLFFSLLTSFVIIYALVSTRATVHLYYMIPLTLACGVGMYVYYSAILGYPTRALGVEKFELLGYTSTDEEIFMWVFHDNDTKPRAYEFDYDVEKHAELERAMDKKAAGQVVQGEFKEAEGVTDISAFGTEKSAEADFELYDINTRDLLPPKDYRKSPDSLETYIPTDSENVGP